MTSQTSRLTLDAAADAPGKTGDSSGTAAPSVAAEIDADRTGLVLSFNAFDLAAGEGASPVNVPGAFALFLFDDGRSDVLPPSWDRYTLACAAGETLQLGPADAPLPALRVTVALHLPDGITPAAYRFAVVVGEHATADHC